MTTAAAEDREHVGPYQVVQAIGAGGSARIDLARIERAYGFVRHVVIKRPLEHLRTSPQVAASLRREARIGARLRHPNLVGILDAGVHDSYDYLVLEYVHGASLRTLMQTDTPGQVRDLPLPVALAIVADVARGMHEAHELTDDQGSPLGLVHRDVSPGNVLLGLDGTVKLADFGIAKETRISTLSGSMHGTVTYMAPEQCVGHAFDRRADVFSLGVILYELVTSTRLFWADNDVASLHRVLSGAVPRPRKVKPQLSSALEDIVMTAVAHDAPKRYPTALELATALELHAAHAGEVLGARWIARTVERVVGPRPVPWIAQPEPHSAAPTIPALGPALPDSPAPTNPESAVPTLPYLPPAPTLPESAVPTLPYVPPAPTIPDVAPREGSLVELIAAAEQDDSVEPTFGDDSDDIEPVSDEPVAAAAVSAERSPRRRRAVVAGIVVLGLAVGSVTTALVMRPTATPAMTTVPGAKAAEPPTPGPPLPDVRAASTSDPPRASDPAPAREPPAPVREAPAADAPRPAERDPSPMPERGTAAPTPERDTPAPPPTRPAAQPSDRAHPAEPPGPAAVVSPAGVRNKRRKPPAARAAPREAEVTITDDEPPIPATKPPTPAARPPTPATKPPTPPAPRPSAPPAPPTPRPAAEPGAGASAPPPAGAPPAKVEWKPSLLLPTDGSAARPPK